MIRSKGQSLTEIFRNNVRSRRLKLGLSQKELGDRVGIRQARIADYEAGRYDPSLAIVEKIATARMMGCQVGCQLGGVDRSNPSSPAFFASRASRGLWSHGVCVLGPNHFPPRAGARHRRNLPALFRRRRRRKRRLLGRGAAVGVASVTIAGHFAGCSARRFGLAFAGGWSLGCLRGRRNGVDGAIGERCGGPSAGG